MTTTTNVLDTIMTANISSKCVNITHITLVFLDVHYLLLLSLTRTI